MDTLIEFIQTDIFPYIPESEEERPIFNPYSQINPQVDRPDAVGIRQQNILSYLAAYSTHPRILIVGEAPGWRGCRFSGVPFTSEAQIVSGSVPFPGRASSVMSAEIWQGHHTPLSEASATIFWSVLHTSFPRFFAWNCVPFHPHMPGNPLSNRTVLPSEIKHYAFLLQKLVCCLQPVNIIALGRKAARALSDLGYHYTQVRHPAHGGAAQFRTAMATYRFNVDDRKSTKS